MDDLPDALARLSDRLEQLERRVSALERSSESSHSVATRAASPTRGISAAGNSGLPLAGGVFPVVGKALLGIAGAYLLRALAESGTLPQMVIVGLALAYAGMWLLWAARIPANVPFASAAYALTSGLILAPMLWELTLRFKVLPAFVTAVVLSTFVVGALVLAWRRNLAAVVWIANVTAAFTALALMIATHDLAPFVAALLVMATASEFAAKRNPCRRIRYLAAPAADFAIWILIYIYSLPGGARAEYPAVEGVALLTLPSVLFLIYGASVGLRTIWLRERITIFEIAQTVIAFLLAAFSVLWFEPGMRAGLGVFCLLFSAACYTAAFVRFDPSQQQRNYHVYSTWSAALLLAGSFLCLPSLPLAFLLSVAAMIATVAGVRMARLTLEFHGLLYLAAAAFASGLLEYAARALAGTFPNAPGWTVWIVAASTLLCYAVGGRFPGERWNQRLLRLLSAILAVSAAATLLVSGLVWLAAIGMTPGASHVAVIRTLIISALALGLAFSGARWQRVELVWTAYGTLAFVTAKLLFEDLAQGHSGSIAISIFLYAVALILVPRMARLAPQRRQSTDTPQPVDVDLGAVPVSREPQVDTATRA
jgi:hypothetical protein